MAPYSYSIAARFTPPAGAPIVIDFSTFSAVSIVEPIDAIVMNELVTIQRSRIPVLYGWWRDIQIQCIVSQGSADDANLATIRRYMVHDEIGQEITLDYSDGAAAVWRPGYFSSATRQKLDGKNIGALYDLYFKCQDLLRDLPAGDLAGPPVMTGP
jgi:hypothetical protein